MLRTILFPLAFLCWFSLHAVVSAQPKKFEPNYDEAKVPAYTLPPILTAADGTHAEIQNAWKIRRAELLQIFTEQMFGSAPNSPYEVKYNLVESGPSLNGKAQRQQFEVVVTTSSGSLAVNLLVYTPTKAEHPVPCFFGAQLPRESYSVRRTADRHSQFVGTQG